MRLKICIKSRNKDQKQARSAAAERVVAEFGNALPDERLLCFFDDQAGASPTEFTVGLAR
jgi:hypothetical protein